MRRVGGGSHVWQPAGRRRGRGARWVTLLVVGLLLPIGLLGLGGVAHATDSSPAPPPAESSQASSAAAGSEVGADQAASVPGSGSGSDAVPPLPSQPAPPAAGSAPATESPLVAIPSPPQDVQVTRDATTRLTVTWSAAMAAVEGISEFRIWTEVDGLWSAEFQPVRVADPWQWQVDGTPGHGYAFRVTAINQAGESPASPSSEPVAIPVPDPPAPSEPPAPQPSVLEPSDPSGGGIPTPDPSASSASPEPTPVATTVAAQPPAAEPSTTEPSPTAPESEVPSAATPTPAVEPSGQSSPSAAASAGTESAPATPTPTAASGSPSTPAAATTSPLPAKASATAATPTPTGRVAAASKSQPLPLPGTPPGVFLLSNVDGSGHSDGCLTQCWNHVEWYSFTAPSSGQMIIKAASIDTGWDNTLEVWVGSNLIMQRDDSYGLDAQVVFDTTAGTTYTLGLGGYRYTSVGNAWVSFLTGAPSVPVQVAATTTSGEATITWSAPAAAAESVSSFRVQAFRNGVAEGSPSVVNGTPPATTTHVTGLTDYASYTFTVTAVNALGESAASAPSAPVVPRPPLPPPTQLPAPTATLAGVNSAAIDVSWQASTAEELSGYLLTTYVDGVAAGPPQVVAASSTSMRVTASSLGHSYTFAVQATNPAGASPLSGSSAPVTPTTLPGSVTGLTVAVTGPTTATATWSPPADSGGAPVTGYVVTTIPDHGGCSTPATSCVLTGLTPGEAMTVTVEAVTSVGRSAPVTSAPFTPMGPPTAPGRPQVRTAGTTSARVTWSAPTASNGAPITGYTATARPGGASCTAMGDTRECVLSNLTVGGTYEVSVVAGNAAGESPPSPASSPYVQQAPGQGSLSIGFQGSVGQPAAGMPVAVSGTGLLAGSTVTVIVQSDPQVVGTTTVATSGAFGMTVLIPAGLEPGNHRVIVTGTDPNGLPVNSQTPFVVGADGSVLSINNSPIPSPTPTPVPPDPTPPPAPTPVPANPSADGTDVGQATAPLPAPQEVVAAAPAPASANVAAIGNSAASTSPSVLSGSASAGGGQVPSLAISSAIGAVSAFADSGGATAVPAVAATEAVQAGGAGTGRQAAVAVPPQVAAAAPAPAAQAPAASAPESSLPFGVFSPTADAALMLTTVGLSSLALLSMAGGKLGLAAPAPAAGVGAGVGAAEAEGGSDEDDSDQDDGDADETGLESGETDYEGFAVTGAAWGDVSRSWAVVPAALPLVDRWSRRGPVATAKVSPLTGRILVDGSYLRAALGSTWAVLPVLGVVLGGALAAGQPTLWQPALALVIGGMVLGILDAASGLGVALGYLAVILLRGQVTDASALRLALGVMSLWVLVPLVAAASRPFTRFGATGAAGIYDRVADFVIAAAISAWLAVTIVQSWPALAGLDLPISADLAPFAFAAAAAVALRMVLETLIAHGYPERRAWCDPGELPESSRIQQVAGLLVAVALFLFVTWPFLGGTWQWWAAAVVIFTPAIASMFADRFPNSRVLHRVIPVGITAVVFVLIVETLASGAINDALAGRPDQLAMGFLIMAGLATVIALVEILGRDGDYWELNWWGRIAGIGVFALGVWLVLHGMQG